MWKPYNHNSFDKLTSFCFPTMLFLTQTALAPCSYWRSANLFFKIIYVMITISIQSMVGRTSKIALKCEFKFIQKIVIQISFTCFNSKDRKKKCHICDKLVTNKNFKGHLDIQHGKGQYGLVKLFVCDTSSVINFQFLTILQSTICGPQLTTLFYYPLLNTSRRFKF